MKCIRVWLVAWVLCACLPGLPGEAQQPRPAQIVSLTTSEGVGWVTYTTSERGIDAQVGRWDGTYPAEEPTGYSTFAANIDVNDGGIVSFDWRFRTYDTRGANFVHIWIEDASGSLLEPLVWQAGRASKPGEPSYGTFWESPSVTISKKLDAYRNQRIRLVFYVYQSGYEGAQGQARIFSLAVRTCQVPPLTPITDPAAIEFENGNRLNTTNITPETTAGIACVSTEVQRLGGGFSLVSAYRPPAYQDHLSEVWQRWQLLKNRREPECESLRERVMQEMLDHELAERPAPNVSYHERGMAFDASITGVTTEEAQAVGATCGLVQGRHRTGQHHFTAR